MPEYTIDNSAIMDLHGYNPHTSYTSDLDERERIWEGVIRLIQEGRLGMVRAVRDEMKRRAIDCYDRLKPHLSLLVRQDTTAILTAVGQITDRFPSLVPDLDTRTNTREPGDPYVIAYAQLNPGCIVVTSEKHRNDRTPSNRSGDRIPDVCDALGSPWMYLSRFVLTEGL